MKKFVFITFSILAVFLTSCSSDDDFTGSGIIITEARIVSNFSKIYSEGIANVNIIHGPVQSLEVSADNNIMSRVNTSVLNDELHISLEDGNYDNIAIEIDIITPNLNGVKNIGVGEFNVFDFNCGENIDIEISGTGKINMSGVATNMSIKNEGSGAFFGYSFIAANVFIQNTGAGDCQINCTETLDVSIDGSGDVYYKGYPSTSVNISGSGKVIDAN